MRAPYQRMPHDSPRRDTSRFRRVPVIRYKPEVLEELATPRLAPAPGDHAGAPSRADQRPLPHRDPADSATGAAPASSQSRELPDRVRELRKRYVLLSIPVHLWTDVTTPHGDALAGHLQALQAPS